MVNLEVCVFSLKNDADPEAHAGKSPFLGDIFCSWLLFQTTGNISDVSDNIDTIRI